MKAKIGNCTKIQCFINKKVKFTSGQTNLYRAKPENNHSFELTACDFLQRKKIKK